MWSLPSGSLNKGENFEKAVIRTGKDKLGVIVKVVKLLGEGKADRGEYITYLKEYEVEMIKGIPSCPQPIQGITQYTKWKWGNKQDLKPAAELNSLCSSIFLRTNELPRCKHTGYLLLK